MTIAFGEIAYPGRWEFPRSSRYKINVLAWDEITIALFGALAAQLLQARSEHLRHWACALGMLEPARLFLCRLEY